MLKGDDQYVPNPHAEINPNKHPEKMIHIITSEIMLRGNDQDVPNPHTKNDSSKFYLESIFQSHVIFTFDFKVLLVQ